jgi:hypothetical protein
MKTIFFQLCPSQALKIKLDTLFNSTRKWQLLKKDTHKWVIFQKMKTVTEGEISNWTNWHNFGCKIMSIWYFFQIQLLSAIYDDKFFFPTFISNSVKMITNTDLLPQRYHFLLGMVKDPSLFPFDNDMKKAHFVTKLCIYHEKTVSVYQRNTIFTVYSKKSGN